MRWFVGICSFGRDSDLRGIGDYLSARLDRGRAPAMVAAVLARADTGRLRRSLVDQIVSAYLKRLGRNRPVKTLERLAANTYGASIAEAMIAQMLTANADRGKSNEHSQHGRDQIERQHSGKYATHHRYRYLERDRDPAADIAGEAGGILCPSWPTG
jgi:hypothetical protein